MVPTGLIAVVRASSREECRTIVTGLVKGGVPTIEVTMTVPGALEVVRELAGAGATVGVGTVLNLEDCAGACAAGAEFLVAPVTDLDVLGAARRAGVAYVGGAFSPSEVLAAMRAGVDAVKIFPAGAVGGPAYVKALREPFPELRAVVSGGVGPEDVAGYIAAGAHAICMGGALVDRAAALAGDVERVAAHARRIVDAFAAAAEPSGRAG